MNLPPLNLNETATSGAYGGTLGGGAWIVSSGGKVSPWMIAAAVAALWLYMRKGR